MTCIVTIWVKSDSDLPILTTLSGGGHDRTPLGHAQLPHGHMMSLEPDDYIVEKTATGVGIGTKIECEIKCGDSARRCEHVIDVEGGDFLSCDFILGSDCSVS